MESVPWNPVWSELFTNFPEGSGFVQVEIQDQNGNPISGYTADDCEPILGDGVELEVAWKDRKDMAPLAGRVVRSKFILGNASLFSFRIR